jgi:hypothetical protein
MVGVDASSDGVRIANERWPGLDVFQRSLYDDLAAAYGRFDAATCIEVIEHLFDPPAFLARQALGWRPLLDLDATLALTADWYRAAVAGQEAGALLGLTLAQIGAYEALSAGA